MVPVPVPKKKPPTEDADIIELDDEEEEIDDVEEDVRFKKNEYLLNGSGVKKWTFFKRSQIFF